MENFPKNQENVGEDSGSGAEVLSEMPPFEEHKASAEKRAGLGEKYYQQAEAERDRWVEISRNLLDAAESLSPDGQKIIENWDEYMESGKIRGSRLLDKSSQADMARFNEYKAREIARAGERLREDKNTDLDELARCFRNKELIDQIAVKLENNEDFNEKEMEFLGDGPTCDGEFFDTKKFLTPDMCYQLNHSIFAVPRYRDLLDKNDLWGMIKSYPQWAVVARAQMREAIRQDRLLLDADEEVQASLSDMEERRAENPFAGETNINSGTGEARTFTLEDNYPRLENESEEDYANRLKRIRLKTRLAEKRQ